MNSSCPWSTDSDEKMAQVKLRQDQRERQFNVALEAATALDRDHQRRLFLVLYDRLEGDTAEPPRIEVTASVFEPDGQTKSAVAEQLVLGRPDGVTPAEVGAQIGQAAPVADSTLRYVAKSRGTILRRDNGRWYPSGSAPINRPPKLREAISRVLGNGQALGTADIHRVVMELLPLAMRGGVASELMRMKKAGLVVARGSGGRGALYALATSRAAPANAAFGTNGVKPITLLDQVPPTSLEGPPKKSRFTFT